MGRVMCCAASVLECRRLLKMAFNWNQVRDRVQKGLGCRGCCRLVVSVESVIGVEFLS